MRLTGLLELFDQLPAYDALLETLREGALPRAQQLPRAVRPALLARLSQDWAGPIFFVTSRVDTMQVWQQDLQGWLPSSVDTLRFLEPTPLPYERGPWSERCRQYRTTALTRLARLRDPLAGAMPDHTAENRSLFVMSSARALLQKTMPRQRFMSSMRNYRVGQLLDLDKMQEHWVHIGYESVPVVETPGQFSQRGGIIDIFPIDSPFAVRVELFGDEIDTLRYFDPATQRTAEAIAHPDRVTVPPAREAMPGDLQPLGLAFEEEATPKNDDLPAWQDDIAIMAAGLNGPHNEYYLPLIYGRTDSIIEYLPDNALVVVDDWDELAKAVHDLRGQADQLAEEQESLPDGYTDPLFTWDDISAALRFRRILVLGSADDGIIFPAPATAERNAGGPPAQMLQDSFQPGPRYGGQTKPFFIQLNYAKTQGERTVVVSRQAQRMAELWQQEQDTRSGGSVIVPHLNAPPVVEEMAHLPSAAISFVQGSLSEGFTVERIARRSQPSTIATSPTILNLLTDAELFGWNRPAPRRQRAPRPVAPEAYFADIEAGDYVVHLEHGIGRFIGLVSRSVGGNEREYLQLQFANSDTLYVPVHHADRLTKWIGSDDRGPKLNRLGDRHWGQAKARAQKAVDEMADELLELYATRETVHGHAFSTDDEWQSELEASFPYQETDDQLRALAEVKGDMQRPHPMDRLICGDVGYGKTEVALRAAFKAVLDGKQVAILVPTTILAQQHFVTFRERLKPFPVVVRMLSRFRTKSQQERTVRGLRDGSVDIVIGTHRLLSDDVSFKDLGLLVIDEEQRFGVRHKETLKQMRTEVDVLTMTATPIPRTLHMGLSGVRDISIIATAPADRLPVQTFVGEFDDTLMRRAVLRELDRGGQVFLVHNRVQTIDIVYRRLQKLVPEARIAIGHGQMGERDLEQVMQRFADGEIDVLLSTTIIESGLDFPNANTLIVDRAEMFGLSQLHQLRGRVGRGVNRAYSYFFHSPWRTLTEDARQRLDTVAQQSHLGAGYGIAMRDLEIRGVGDMLGARQSGHISEVGFDLYTRMLARAVKRKRAEKRGEELPPDLPEVTLIDLPLATYVPGDYVPDPGLRLRLYRRMAGLETMADVDEMAAELADRFGAIPDPVDNLLYQLRIKSLAQRAAVASVTTDSGQLKLRMPQLEQMNRFALQRHLGRNARVSRKAIWLPKEMPTREWQVMLVQILEKLHGFKHAPQVSLTTADAR